MKVIHTQTVEHHNQKRAMLIFNFDYDLIEKEKKLPVVLSEEEVVKILRHIVNLKHRCIIYLIYSAGLRLSEVINLKISDIDSNRKMITIKGAKGKKDRISLLSDAVLALLREYYKQYKPKE